MARLVTFRRTGIVRFPSGSWYLRVFQDPGMVPGLLSGHRAITLSSTLRC